LRLRRTRRSLLRHRQCRARSQQSRSPWLRKQAWSNFVWLPVRKAKLQNWLVELNGGRIRGTPSGVFTGGMYRQLSSATCASFRLLLVLQSKRCRELCVHIPRPYGEKRLSRSVTGCVHRSIEV